MGCMAPPPVLFRVCRQPRHGADEVARAVFDEGQACGLHLIRTASQVSSSNIWPVRPRCHRHGRPRVVPLGGCRSCRAWLRPIACYYHGMDYRGILTA
jgi:hypothetical protein